MKNFLLLALVFTLLTAFLGLFGERTVQAGRRILPASWTVQSADNRVISLRNYGMDQFLRQTLFGPPARCAILFSIVGFFAVVGVVVFRSISRESELAVDPRWGWADLLWIFLGVVVFWEAIPDTDAISTGILFLQDASLFIWIWIVGISRGLRPRDWGLTVAGVFQGIGMGLICALLILPALALIGLCALVSGGPSGVPSDFMVPVPTSRAAAWLSVLILPFFEEVLFRCFLYRLLRARWPQWLSNLAVSLIFAAVHGVAGPAAALRFMGSLLMCRLFERTGTLWPGLAAHAAFNAMLLIGPGVL